jgi:hypothetical protein
MSKVHAQQWISSRLTPLGSRGGGGEADGQPIAEGVDVAASQVSDDSLDRMRGCAI